MVLRRLLPIAAFFALLLSTSAYAAPASVQFNGNTYYKVEGNNPAMDTGKEVCASIGKTCTGFKSIKTNSICKLFHPTAKELTSMNGSQAGFYCNGAPQQGLACANMKNTCQVCPNCNLNEAASCDNPIGQHFAEMYVFCGAAASSKAGTYGPLPLPKSSTPNLLNDPNNCGRVGNKCLTGSICKNGICVRQVTSSSSSTANSVTCTLSNTPLKKVTCTAYKAGDTFCATSLGSNQAKAVICNDKTVSCTLPCSAPGASNLKSCPFGGVKSGNCPAPTPTQTQGKGAAGALCVHGGDCQSGWCLGVIPGRLYECSCIDPVTQVTGCRK